MTMRAQGVLYMSRTQPLATRAANGRWQLTLLLMDRIAPLRVEPWFVSWAGPEAEAWWRDHEADLTPGTPLQVTACDIRAMARNGRAPQTHARLLACRLVPRPQPARAAAAGPDEHGG